MNPKSKKNSGLLSRFASVVRGHGDRLAASHGTRENSAENADRGPPQFLDSPTLPVSDLVLFADNLNLEKHRPQPPQTRQNRNENNMVSSHCAAVSPLSNTTSGALGGTSFFHGASGFQVRDFNVNVNSPGNESIDGTSIH